MSRRTRSTLAIASLLAYFAPDEHGCRPHVRMPRSRPGGFSRGDHTKERTRRRRQIERGMLQPTKEAA